ncbi:hypothetical protein CFC21_063286 [Triticum aestivum]|uniref:PGG domain-containing protein n=6 Tax=Triticinae TaxID=1648030 RepID=A0A453J3R1_AEGTS|nr:serine/threonine-protein phosphatase 6 regulatory ankyrin repeat subunit A [Aegilops tauschii subsp. strangulata]XP_044378355.1 serine/threonine-protein phosphatase 6 regulatory ankyrin repeat subunit A-like [Triticum aestivum]KAF7055805.1 hypothetical protein CFC21_063286 [Triticum aestivum]
MDLGRPASCKDGSMFMCPRLYTAAFEGQTEEVTGLLMGSSVDAPAAARNGRPSTAVNHRGPCTAQEVTAERNTLLHIAAGQGHGGLIAELCYRDSSLLSSVNKALDTPLHSAARAGGANAVEDIVRLARANCLEEGGVIIRGKNVAGDTAMHLAARHGHGAAVEKLVKLAPELASELNRAGVSSLYLAVTSGSVDAVRAIVSHGDASAAGPNQQNALHAAVLESSEMVDLLLQWRPALGSDLDINKSSPLHFASSDGDCSVIEKIITHSPPNTTYLQDSEGLSALSAAALMGHVSAVRLLLRFHPACADVRDNHGRTFLHAAAMKGHSSIVSYVIKDIMLEHLLNTQDNEGNTPLHLAVVAGEHKVIYKLLSSGKVRAHIMNDAGCTPSDLIENSTGFYSMASLVVELYVMGARFRPQRQDHIEKWNGQDIMKWRETTSKNIAVVSTLVATVAFSAAFNVPGSYGSSGKANLSGHRRYDAFMVLDTIAMTTSVIATILLIYGRASRSHRSWLGFMVAMHFLWLSLNSMMLAFFTAMVAVMREKNSMKVALTQVIYNGLYILMTLLANLATPRSLLGVMQLLVGSCFERRRRAKRRISRQFPFVIFYALNVVVFIVVNTLALSAIQVTGGM